MVMMMFCHDWGTRGRADINTDRGTLISRERQTEAQLRSHFGSRLGGFGCLALMLKWQPCSHWFIRRGLRSWPRGPLPQRVGAQLAPGREALVPCMATLAAAAASFLGAAGHAGGSRTAGLLPSCACRHSCEYVSVTLGSSLGGLDDEAVLSPCGPHSCCNTCQSTWATRRMRASEGIWMLARHLWSQPVDEP